MNSTIRSINDHLIHEGLIVHPIGDGEGIVVHMTLKHLRLAVSFLTGEEKDFLRLDALLPVPVPADRRTAVSDFLTRVNWNLRLGRFVMDFSDGEIRFRQELDSLDDTVDVKRAEVGLLRCCHMVDAFFPALMGVIFRETPPEEALAQGEKDLEALAKDEE
ncbi:MAG: YbjN domain-containing protein [Verrucomicrobiota bacterium]